MKCTACGAEFEGNSCTVCGHQASGIDATGTFTLDDSVFDTNIDVSSLPRGTAALVVVRGPSTGEVWTLRGDVVEVGRSADSGLFLDDITVSRRHATFRKTSAGWSLEDNGSLNGSYVNRNLLTSVTELHDGDEIQLGKFRFTFHEGDK